MRSQLQAWINDHIDLIPAKNYHKNVKIIKNSEGFTLEISNEVNGKGKWCVYGHWEHGYQC